MIDFIEDASRDDSTVGMHFLEELNKGTKAKDIHDMLVNWGYDGVDIKEVERMVDIVKNKSRAKNAILETGY